MDKNLPKNFEPSQIEEKWYDYWMKHKLFHSEPDDRKPYTIVIPPPNVTGVLHMGHILNNTIQDILIRHARMKGYNALWVPGTDHASIATEAKVVAKLKKQGIDKYDLTREQFLEHAWEWTHEHGGIILKQLRKLGASADWDRTNFTLDEHYYQSVIKVFVDLYNKGLIYRGYRMVNWDPEAKTAISDEEVIYKEIPGKLWYVKYPVVGEDDAIVIATTRPETILADTAIAVNPQDERYKKYIGKKVIVPLIEREIPVIADDYVDPVFGTGALKVTPAHDPNDYEIGQRHNLEVIDIFNEDATLNENAKFFVGKDRFEAQKLMVEELDRRGLLVKEEDYLHNVGFSQRTDVPIEPRLSKQWFLKMKPLAEPALKAVMDGEIRFVPEMFKNTYRHWMENIRDWNISRQLWWGHRIPAYYIRDTEEFVVAETKEQALELAKEKTGDQSLTMDDLHQDPDTLDTWFSSWLWPIAVFDGIRHPDNPDINYYYPTSVLVTGHDIIFFWVARMIMAGYHYRGTYPFKDVYFTGMVRDNQGRKMSKSLGNSPDPLDLISKYGADGVRFGILSCSPAGGDLLYKDDLPQQGRNFANKIWNAFRLISMWKVDETLGQPAVNKVAVEWFEHKLNSVIDQTEKMYDNYRLSEILMTLYQLFWDDFASWYLEIIKPKFNKEKNTAFIDRHTLEATKSFFDSLLRLLHPFMPFITEELWQKLKERKQGQSIMYAPYPEAKGYDQQLLELFEDTKKIISTIRSLRKEYKIEPQQKLNIKVRVIDGQYNSTFDDVIRKLSGIDQIELINDKIKGAKVFMIKTLEYNIPLGDLIDLKKELIDLIEQYDYQKGFLQSVLKKLNNEKFLSRAPEQVVAREKEKKASAEAKLKALKEQISELMGLFLD